MRVYYHDYRGGSGIWNYPLHRINYILIFLTVIERLGDVSIATKIKRKEKECDGNILKKPSSHISPHQSHDYCGVRAIVRNSGAFNPVVDMRKISAILLLDR